jgi:cytochrome c6
MTLLKPVLTAVATTTVLVFTLMPAHAEKINGEAEFKEHCAACHADGGNLINPSKPLFRKDREKSGLKKAGDLIRVMRKPGPGMSTFDKKSLPDKEAQAIAEYIIKTFK